MQQALFDQFYNSIKKEENVGYEKETVRLGRGVCYGTSQSACR